MTKQEFIDSYCLRSNVTWEKLSERRIALPCACGQEGCEGWAMVSNDTDDIRTHMYLYAQLPPAQ